MNYIRPVTRYIQNQGWPHNTTALKHICIILALSLDTYKTRGVHLKIRHAHMHYISPVTPNTQNTRGVHLTEIRHVQMHYISPVTRYIQNTRCGHIHLFVIPTCCWLSNCRKCYTYFNDLLVCYRLHWQRTCALLDVALYSPVYMCRRFGVSVCFYHQSKLKKNGMLLNLF
jgi:hypothetical protein